MSIADATLFSLVVLSASIATGALLARLARAPVGDARQQLVEKINSLLPQTQCAQCGFPGCRPYAEALIDDQAAINQCPPGGTATITQLADLLGRNRQDPDTSYGLNKPPQLAIIDEGVCIGCTLCIHACPVDAIVGASQMMHTVIAADCTGCELCIPPCPVDCIALVSPANSLNDWHWPKPV